MESKWIIYDPTDNTFVAEIPPGDHNLGQIVSQGEGREVRWSWSCDVISAAREKAVPIRFRTEDMAERFRRTAHSSFLRRARVITEEDLVVEEVLYSL